MTRGNESIKVLLVADTHIGFDWVRRPRSSRPRRSEDFLANFEYALEPARVGAVDLVVHAGDLLYRSRVPAELVRIALEPLLQVADRGVSVILVPGNHERSALPFPLLGLHEHLHVADRPGTVRLDFGGLEVAVVAVPCVREGVAEQFSELVEAAEDGGGADVRLLAAHQAVEGATVGPSDFVFRHGSDVVPGAAIPSGYAAVLAGHIHRHQVLTHDLTGRRLAAPVLYPGSVERTSFAERHEEKGFVTLECSPGPAGGRLASWRFHTLPTRPMVVLQAAAHGHRRTELEAGLIARLLELPPRAVVRIDLEGLPPGGPFPHLATLRAACPPEMIIELRPPRRAQEPTTT